MGNQVCEIYIARMGDFLLTTVPDPECYQLGKRRLALSSSAESTILVFEDAPAGIKAGLAAGCKVIGLATSHSIESVVSAGAHWVVRDLESVQFEKDVSTAELRMTISNSLIVLPTDADP